MIFTTLPVRHNTMMTEQYWKDQARGVIDEYGNPFRIIKLRWRNTPNHRCADYQKTSGFEDAIIKQDNQKNIMIKYRQGGNVMWTRPPGGVGGFTGELAVTPKNMSKLAAHVRNGLWDIIDDDIRVVVEGMYRKREAVMDPATKKFNEAWYRAMHVSALDKDSKEALNQAQAEVDTTAIKEQQRLLEIEKQELSKKKAALDIKEADITNKAVESVKSGKAASSYKREYLEHKTTVFKRLIGICKELGVLRKCRIYFGDILDHAIADMNPPVFVDMVHHLFHPPATDEISGGEKERAAIARARGSRP